VGVAPVISLLTTLLVGGRGGCCGCCISGFGCCSGTSVVVAVAVADEEHWVAKAIRPTMKYAGVLEVTDETIGKRD